MSKKSSASKIKVSSFNDLFGMNDSIDNSGEIKNIPLDELYEFNNHPFKIRDNEKMDELIASIKEHGVLVPGIARIRPQGGYEIIAGHSRIHACKALGMNDIPMFIRNISDDEAVMVMVDSNIQREDILPSEKARAYKMKYEAIKHQGKKGNSLDILGEDSGDSRKVIQRFIWLANLSDELLELVDQKLLGFTQGVDISFLNNEEQEWLLNVMNKSSVKLSTKQAAEIKKHSQDGELTEALLWEILSSGTSKKIRKVSLNNKRLNEYFADNYTEEDIEEIIFTLLDEWKKKSEE